MWFRAAIKATIFPCPLPPLLSALNCSSVTDCYWYGWSGWLCSFPSIDNRGALYRWMDDGRGDGSCRLSCDALWVILLDKHIPPLLLLLPPTPACIYIERCHQTSYRSIELIWWVCAYVEKCFHPPTYSEGTGANSLIEEEIIITILIKMGQRELCRVGAGWLYSVCAWWW